jgi:hypothetical protein
MGPAMNPCQGEERHGRMTLCLMTRPPFFAAVWLAAEFILQ